MSKTLKQEEGYVLFLASSCAIALERTAKRWKAGLCGRGERKGEFFFLPSVRKQRCVFLSSFSSNAGVAASDRPLSRSLFKTDGIHRSFSKVSTIEVLKEKKGSERRRSGRMITRRRRHRRCRLSEIPQPRTCWPARRPGPRSRGGERRAGRRTCVALLAGTAWRLKARGRCEWREPLSFFGEEAGHKTKTKSGAPGSGPEPAIAHKKTLSPAKKKHRLLSSPSFFPPSSRLPTSPLHSKWLTQVRFVVPHGEAARLQLRDAKNKGERFLSFC